MTRIVVRNLAGEDREALRLFAANACGFLAQAMIPGGTCLVALADGSVVGSALCFVRDRDAYCTTLAAGSESLRSRVTPLLVARCVRALLGRPVPVAACRFAVDPGDAPARALYAMLGATELGRVQDLADGADRIVSMIDPPTFARLRAKYARLGLVPLAPALARAA